MKTKKIYYDNIEKKTLNNGNYREVLYTVPDRMQLVVMSISSEETIPGEIHDNITQFIRVESGKGNLKIKYGDGFKNYKLTDGISVIIPPGLYHEVINTGKEDLKIYTIYSPPEHDSNLIQKNQK
jgi:mannose-6-phosphate isomerase-like protein (cupin superfamily)